MTRSLAAPADKQVKKEPVNFIRQNILNARAANRKKRAAKNAVKVNQGVLEIPVAADAFERARSSPKRERAGSFMSGGSKNSNKSFRSGSQRSGSA